MTSINRRILMTATFVVAVTLTAAILTISAIGTSMVLPVFAQGDNMTGGGGNATEGNMTGTDMAGSGMATPPVMTP